MEDRGQVAGDERATATDHRQTWEGRKGRREIGREGLRTRRVRWTASNKQRRNGKQSFLAWAAWLTLIERGWAAGGAEVTRQRERGGGEGRVKEGVEKGEAASE